MYESDRLRVALNIRLYRPWGLPVPEIDRTPRPIAMQAKLLYVSW